MSALHVGHIIDWGLRRRRKLEPVAAILAVGIDEKDMGQFHSSHMFSSMTEPGIYAIKQLGRGHHW